MMSGDGEPTPTFAQPQEAGASGTFYEEISTSVGGVHSGPVLASAPVPVPAAPSPPPAAAASSSSSAPPAEANPAAQSFQSFQDLDISSPNAPGGAGSSGLPASRFDSKAASGGGELGGGVAPDLAVVVSNPAKCGEGYSAYFTYEVTTKTSLPQYQFGQFSVTRRFRDFDWLHGQLCLKFPGAIVPPLPEKQATSVATMKVTLILTLTLGLTLSLTLSLALTLTLTLVASNMAGDRRRPDSRVARGPTLAPATLPAAGGRAPAAAHGARPAGLPGGSGRGARGAQGERQGGQAAGVRRRRERRQAGA